MPKRVLIPVDVVAHLNGLLAVRAHGRLIVFRTEKRLAVAETLRHLASVQLHGIPCGRLARSPCKRAAPDSD
ncbi:hypothetical protein PV779_45260 [Streptomyces sp. ID01-9D]|nr:hypothetical protein [Streptomyces sp. ID01-9D]